MTIEWKTHAYGRESDLAMLNRARNNPDLPASHRLQADKSHKAIIDQLRDKKLMAMRAQLIEAVRAGDETATDRITRQIRDYRKEDQETGL